MVQQGSFPQLRRILDTIQRANPMEENNDSDDDDELEEEDADRMLGLPGIRGEARVQMLSDDILRQLEQQANGTEDVNEVDDDDYMEQERELTQVEDDKDEISLPALPPVHRQTFIYSATLTLRSSSSTSSRKSKRRQGTANDIDGPIAEILQVAHGKTKVIDLSHSGKAPSDVTKKEKKKKERPRAEGKFQLPPGLRLQQIKCTQLHKDSHLYAYLMTTKDGASGPCLVFCNSIAAVRRVGATLQALGMQVRILHANMQQVGSLHLFFGVCVVISCNEEK